MLGGRGRSRVGTGKRGGHDGGRAEVLRSGAEVRTPALVGSTSVWSDLNLFRKTDLHARGPPAATPAALESGVGAADAPPPPPYPLPPAFAADEAPLVVLQRQYAEAVRQLQEQLAAVAADRRAVAQLRYGDDGQAAVAATSTADAAGKVVSL